ncbi:gcvH [Bugula neritina]|uniref:Glycine cleavage system H protein, mitochondrial n=1 Tax=Bugula neritina TaxID=10212 RepID=A0A7J7JBR8_BUGNE|nr:gcvH [Bugula neritina]
MLHAGLYLQLIRATKELGDVVYVDLPQVDGQEMAAGDVAASVESVKAVAEVYSPISGVLKAVNTYLENSPGLVNLDPVADGWIIELEVTKPEELDSLMDEAAYAKYLETVE